MKKQLFLCFAMLLCAGVLAGCASDEPLVWSGGRFRWLRLAVLPSPAVGVRRIRATRGNSRRSANRVHDHRYFRTGIDGGL